MKKTVVFMIIVCVFLLCSCSNEDLSEYGGSSLMKSAGRHPSSDSSNQAAENARRISQDLKSGKIEPFVNVSALPTPTPYVRIITEEEKADIDREYSEKLDKLYDEYNPGGIGYNADFIHENAERIKELEISYAQEIAKNHGISVDDVLSAYSGELISKNMETTDPDYLEQEMAAEGILSLQESLDDISREYSENHNGEELGLTGYVADNTLFVDMKVPDMEFALGALYAFGTDRLDREALRSFIDEMRTISLLLDERKNNDGIRSGHTVLSVYDEDRPNEALLVFTDGDTTYNAFEDKDKIWK